jgi:hypothetical protein
MTSDHLTPAQKPFPGFSPHFDDYGWGFGMGVRVRRTQLGPSVGSHEWRGRGNAWSNDPAEDMTTIMMGQRDVEPPFAMSVDVWTAAYQAIDD